MKHYLIFVICLLYINNTLTVKKQTSTKKNLQEQQIELLKKRQEHFDKIKAFICKKQTRKFFAEINEKKEEKYKERLNKMYQGPLCISPDLVNECKELIKELESTSLNSEEEPEKITIIAEKINDMQLK